MFKDPLDELIETLKRAKRSSDKLQKIRDASHRHWLDGDRAHFEKEAMQKLDAELIDTINRILRE